jgi:hypothetical protein
MTNPEAPATKRRCRHISKNGSRCHSDPQTGKDWCFFHDPEQKKKQAEARKQGGEARSRQAAPEITLPPNLPDVCLQKAGDVYDLMNETLCHLQSGKMDVRAAQAIAYLSSLVLRAFKADLRLLVSLLSDTISRVRRGETDLRTGRTIGHITSIMLTALKQEAEEYAAAQPAEPAHPAETMSANALAELGRRLGVESMTTPIAAAKLPHDDKPHPAVINGMAKVAEATYA